MSGYLTTHVLDTARQMPAQGMRITLTRLTGGARQELLSVTTNADGRPDGAILPPDAFEPGEYELEFAVGDDLRGSGQPTGLMQGKPNLMVCASLRVVNAARSASIGASRPALEYSVSLVDPPPAVPSGVGARQAGGKVQLSRPSSASSAGTVRWTGTRSAPRP
jgi:5-hydroxyisourate hydrolase